MLKAIRSRWRPEAGNSGQNKQRVLHRELTYVFRNSPGCFLTEYIVARTAESAGLSICAGGSQAIHNRIKERTQNFHFASEVQGGGYLHSAAPPARRAPQVHQAVVLAALAGIFRNYGRVANIRKSFVGVVLLDGGSHRVWCRLSHAGANKHSLRASRSKRRLFRARQAAFTSFDRSTSNFSRITFRLLNLAGIASKLCGPPLETNGATGGRTREPEADRGPLLLPAGSRYEAF